MSERECYACGNDYAGPDADFQLCPGCLADEERVRAEETKP